MLPDDVLLEVFDFYLVLQGQYQILKEEIEAWQSLVHVCRRWRRVVFESARRLNLRLVCSPQTPVKDTIDVWPELPLFVKADGLRSGSDLRMDCVNQKGVDNIVAALQRRDHVDEIRLACDDDSAMQKAVAAMQVPFPELIFLRVTRWSSDEMATVLPESFLGGSAPRLQDLELYRISFPGLPKLLLSATHLVNLHLQDIPHSGYLSPESMVTALSALTSLENLSLKFQFPQSRPDRGSRRPSPLIRPVLPILVIIIFKGDSEYIDDLVARIDTPRLNELNIIFFNQIFFETPQLIQFISRTPRLKALKEARVAFEGDTASVRLKSGSGWLRVEVRCIEFDWRVSSMEQVCTWCLPPLSTLEDLYILAPFWKPDRRDNIESPLWLELLQPFTAVKNLYLSKKLAPSIVPALQELVGGRQTEVLPILQNIFLGWLEPSGPVQEDIKNFVGARRDPIAVNLWEIDQEDEDEFGEDDEDED